MKEYLKERRKKILSKAEEMETQSVLVLSPENIYYFTGFWGGRYLLISQDQCTLFTSVMEAFRALTETIDTKVVSAPVGTELLSIIKNYFQKGSKILTEDLTFTQKKAIEEKIEVSLNISSKPFYELRRIKDEYEVRTIKEASKRTDQLFEFTLKILKEGISEREIASKIIGRAVEMGLEMPMASSGFEPIIIATGPNSAFPHAPITDRRIKRGDTIKGDYFFRYQAYITDETRTFVLGRATKEFKEAYQTVHFAQEEGLKAVKTGAITGEVDSVCRKIIGNSRYSEYYTHGTGHGVGLEVHEPPSLSMNQTDKLQEGNIITVEPGVYLPKKFGIRIEDTVLVEKKAKVLTRFSKELIEI